jgi:N-acetylglucosaminyl-diphospho-decaprenol L-rhamnosyltransferase
MAAPIAPTTSAIQPSAKRAHSRRNPSSRALSGSSPSVAAIIVNFCQWRNTARLTRQLRRSHVARAGEAEIVVVDNHSPRHSLAEKLRRLPGVSLLRFPQNRGFAHAVNAGARVGRSEWLLLLNPDVSVPPGFLDDLDLFIHQCRDEPRAGIIGLNVRDPDGAAQPCCGSLPTLRRTLTGLLAPRARRKCHLPEPGEATEVPWATGCALLIRRECFEEIAGFDEDFFLYYEDVDLCRRASERGWNVRFEPRLRVKHHAPLHARPVPAPLRLMTRHALLTYGLKHWPRWQTCVLGGIIAIESLVRQLAAMWSGRPQDAYYHSQVRKLASELLGGRFGPARARIEQAAAGLHSNAAAQDGRAC